MVGLRSRPVCKAVPALQSQPEWLSAFLALMSDQMDIGMT